jgi:RNA polymerase sigma-70 factor (ECF subfamily)
MTDCSSNTEILIRAAAAGDDQAVAELFAKYRKRLRRMISLRMDRRLQGRVDPSDVLQDAYLDFAKRLPEYAQSQSYPFFLWLRMLTGQRLMHVHRHHLETAMRDAGQEVSLYHKAMPEANSMSLAANLLGRMTSVSEQAIRAEIQIKLQETLNSMDPIDREILVLRHFEELSNNEAAEVLGIKKAAASNRYIRALKRLKETLATVPGMLGH